MSDYARMDDHAGTHLPFEFGAGHRLCFLIHDTMLEALVSGVESQIFTREIQFRDKQEEEDLAKSPDIIEWLARFREEVDLANVMVSVAFPAVLGDMLNFVYEALDTSRKGKLAVSFALLRKPIQESLFLIEAMFLDRVDFNSKLTKDPQKLRSQKAGGPDAQSKRIAKSIDLLGEHDRFDANYLAQLRYDKSSEDGFDGVCNKATHLITDHKAIQTKPMDINFIFPSIDGHLTQWAYIYSRLPYVLFYTWRVIERVLETMDQTNPVYLGHVDRVLSANVLLWWETVSQRYRDFRLERFVQATRNRLARHCEELDCSLTQDSLARMSHTRTHPV